MIERAGKIDADDMVIRLSESVRQLLIEQLPKGELLVLIRQVENAVYRGTAQMRDYETFVRCQEELARREFPYK